MVSTGRKWQKIWLIIVMMVTVFFIPVSSQSEYRFTNYDFRHGLPVVDISAIAQDSLGNIWLGSKSGSVKFDGYTFEHFKSNLNDSTSISGDQASDIHVAPNGDVWFAFHDNGVSRFNQSDQSFTNWSLDLYPDQSVFNRPIMNVHATSNGSVWLGGARTGLFRLNDETNEFQSFVTSDQMNVGSVYYIEADPTAPNSFYFGERNLYRYDDEENSINQIHVDGSRWSDMISYGHTILYGRAYHDLVTRYNYDLKKSVSKKLGNMLRLTALLPRPNGQLWVATIGSGILILDEELNQIDQILPEAFNIWSISTDVILELFEDIDGRIWIGTDKGLSVYDPADQYIKNVSIRTNETKANDHAHAVMPVRNGTHHLVGSYYSDKVMMHELASGKIETVSKQASAEKLRSPYKMIRKQDKIWIFYVNGLGYWNSETNSIYEVPIQFGDAKLGSRLIMDGGLDKEGRFVMAQLDNILFRYDPVQNLVDTFQLAPPGNEYSPRCIEVNEDDVWIGMTKGMIKLNTITRQKTSYSGDDHTQVAFGLNDLLIEENGDMWVIPYRGSLFRTNLSDPSLKPIKTYQASDGLSGNLAFELAKSTDGEMLLGSPSGVSRYDRENDLFTGFSFEHGLMTNNLNGVSIVDNQAFLTSALGYSYVNLDDLKPTRRLPDFHIQNFQIGNESHLMPEIGDDQSAFKATYNNNDVLIEYVGINLSNPQRTRYQYRLDPIQDWTTVDYNERTIRYENLADGKYTFEIKSSIDGITWTPTQQIKFEVQPPLWKRLWFQILIGLLAISGFYFYFKSRERAIKREEQTKARMAELELKALRSQMNPHFMFNSLNSIKNYILKSKPADAAQYLSSFAHLIRMILQNSREQTVSLSQELETLMLYIELEKLRFKKGFEFTCEVDERLDLDEIHIPPMLLQPYVENAIWHGLMHKEEDAVLSLGFQKQNGTILCTIDDNGIGREKAMELKSSSARKYKSMGMGITKDRIDIHNKMNAMGIEVDIIDKSTNSGISSGTKVQIKIPAHSNQNQSNGH